MKKVFLFLLPFFLAICVFLIIIFVFKFDPSGKGSLWVTSQRISKVYLEEKLIGQTPLCKCDANTMFQSGNYTIKLVPIKGEFQPFEQKIAINKGTLTAVDVIFEDLSNEASVINLSAISNKKAIELLTISFPDKANVFLDNNLAGQTPLLLNNITDSNHDLKISKNGYKDKFIKINTHVGYKLTSLVFMAVNPVLASSIVLSTPSASLEIQKIIVQSPVGFVNVREEGSLSGKKIGVIYSGESFDLIDEKEGWFEIKLKDGKTGWINSSYGKKL